MKKAINLVEYLNKLKKQSKKDRYKKVKKIKISRNKWIKKHVRRFQKENNGVNPLLLIPKNTFYCYKLMKIEYHDPEPPTFEIDPCPFWYSIEIPEEELDNHVGIVAMNQKHIGGCKFIKKTDDDMDGWGLLWDQCKECRYSEER
jgi:hypothetical protein